MIHSPVDTFEHDIADEIRHKEASVTEVVSAVNDIGNSPAEAPKNQFAMMGIVTILILCGVVGIGYLAYSYYFGGTKPTTPVNTNVTKPAPNSDVQLASISPTLNEALGNFLTGIKKTNGGYTITITSYSPVFAYMIRNEKDFADELGQAVGNVHTGQEQLPPPNEATVTSTTTGTSTPTTSTSTETIPFETIPTTEYVFHDVTLSNQNIRVGTSVYGTVAYAFIGTKTLVIAPTPEGILTLRSSLEGK